MPLTAQDVRNKKFATAPRLREGYDMTEVDLFLDEIETSLDRLTKENAELRSGSGKGAAASTPAPAKAEAAAARPESLTVTTSAEASSAATRLLELATRNAEQLVAEAKEQAEKLIADARSTAERLTQESKTSAESVESAARKRAEDLDTETTKRRQSVLADVEAEKARLDAELETLRAFEREYRAELKSYFEEQLAVLDGQGAGGVLSRSSAAAESPTVPAQPSGQQQDKSKLQAVLDER